MAKYKIEFIGDEYAPELIKGYFDGKDENSPEPTNNRHPMYIHGFKNGRDDLRGKPRATAHEIRREYEMIKNMLSD